MIPEPFARTIRTVHGEAGEAWLLALPSLLVECAARWSLTLGEPFAPLSYNYVVPATRNDGTEAVLKLGVPQPEFLNEIGALRLFPAEACVQVLDADRDRGVLLLERLRPGTTLATVTDDAAATRIAAEVMARLWRPLPVAHQFPTVADWARGMERLRAAFGGGTGPFPAPLVELAERLLAELLAISAEPVLLHGDLHHENILAAGSEQWRAIDPKGVAGEPAYEVGALLRNPLPQVLSGPHPARLLGRRLDILAEALCMERERLRAWDVAQAVLSGWWYWEDHGELWEPVLALADHLTRA